MKLVSLLLLTIFSNFASAEVSIEFSNLKQCALGLMGKGFDNFDMVQIAYQGGTSKTRGRYIFTKEGASLITPKEPTSPWAEYDVKRHVFLESYGTAEIDVEAQALSASEAGKALATEMLQKITDASDPKAIKRALGNLEANAGLFRGGLSPDAINEMGQEIGQARKNLEGCDHVANELVKQAARTERSILDQEGDKINDLDKAAYESSECSATANKKYHLSEGTSTKQ